MKAVRERIPLHEECATRNAGTVCHLGRPLSLVLGELGHRRLRCQQRNGGNKESYAKEMAHCNVGDPEKGPQAKTFEGVLELLDA